MNDPSLPAEVEDALRGARIAIVDDHQPNVTLLTRALALAGFANVRSTTDPRTAPDLFRAFDPDILLLDLHMPEVDGFGVMDRLRADLPPGSYLPILVMTGDATTSTRQRALAHGATDFLTKPYNSTEVVLRVRNLLHTRLLHLRLLRQNETLEALVQERTRDLAQARLEVLERLARAAEFRDDQTGRHTQRVGRNAAALARLLGLPEQAVELIGRAAPLHDVGKVGVPDRVLLKRGPLTPEERALMRAHTLIGGHILGEARSAVVRTAEVIARTHHERWDGSGYPHGLAGEQIPLSGRVVAAVDVLDALLHPRPYKGAWPLGRAVEEIAAGAGAQFDPAVVEALVRGLREGRFELDVGG
jgi:putative two-component system response regulator